MGQKIVSKKNFSIIQKEEALFIYQEASFPDFKFYGRGELLKKGDELIIACQYANLMYSGSDDLQLIFVSRRDLIDCVVQIAISFSKLRLVA